MGLEQRLTPSIIMTQIGLEIILLSKFECFYANKNFAVIFYVQYTYKN